MEMCPMKEDLECIATPEIIRECECRSCDYYKQEDREDPFMQRCGKKKLGYHYHAHNNKPMGVC